jgi:hypothetical protein
MRESRDMMERLAAADPLSGGERLTPDEEREAEALLARLLTTPVGAEGRRAPRARRRRLALAAAGVAAVAAGAFVAINLADSGAPGPGVVERAVAAVAAEDVVFHYVERMEATVPSRMGEDMTVYSESWNTADGRFHHKRYTSPGPGAELLSDFAGRRLPGRDLARALAWDAREDTIREMGYSFDSGPVPNLDPLADPGAQLRTLEEQGRLRPAGTTEVDGRRAYRLESGPVSRPDEPESEERVVFLVDAETYLPLQKRHSIDTGVGSATLVSRYTVYERLPLNARTSELLALDAHPGAKCSRTTVSADELGFTNPCARP